MNISHEHRFVFLANPRTGTRVTFAALRDRYGCFGVAPRTAVLTHEMGLPPGSEDYTMIATVRHPGSRLVSLWRWMRKLVDRWPKDTTADWLRKNPDDFTGFVETLANSTTRRGGGFLPQTTQFKRARQPDLLLRFESLQKDFLALPFVREDDPGLNLRAPNPVTTNWRSLYTPRAMSIMAEIYKEDLEALGYLL